MVTDRLRALAGDRRLQVGVALFVLLTFLYSVVIAGQILIWVWMMGYFVALAGFFFGLYLLLRFVLAVERLADAADRLASGRAAGDPPAGTPADSTDERTPPIDDQARPADRPADGTDEFAGPGTDAANSDATDDA
jgi:HAMP domain-containing protein